MSAGAIELTYTTIAQASQQLAATGRKNYQSVMNTLVRAGDLLSVFPIKECNSNTVHQVTRVKSLGDGGVCRAINQGVPLSSGEYEMGIEPTTNFEDRCLIDEELLEVNGGSTEFIKNQNSLAATRMRNNFNDMIWYGNRNVANGINGIDGLSSRYNFTGKIINKNTGQDQVIDFGGTGNNLSSVWLLAPGPNTVYMIHRPGASYGMNIRRMKAEQGARGTDRDGNPFLADETWYKWGIGLCVENPHAVMRLANIPANNFEALINTGTSDPKQSTLIRRLNWMKNYVSEDVDRSRLMLICSRGMFAALDDAIFDKQNAYWRPDDVTGKWPIAKIGSLSGVPVFMSDTLLDTEDQVLPAPVTFNPSPF